jgi:hypothetical protein
VLRRRAHLGQLALPPPRVYQLLELAAQARPLTRDTLELRLELRDGLELLLRALAQHRLQLDEQLARPQELVAGLHLHERAPATERVLVDRVTRRADPRQRGCLEEHICCGARQDTEEHPAAAALAEPQLRPGLIRRRRGRRVRHYILPLAPAARPRAKIGQAPLATELRRATDLKLFLSRMQSYFIG